MDDIVDHIVSCAASAARAGRTTYHSTGEGLAAALVLNRHDWLKEKGYTMVEAIDRLDASWLEALPEAARRFQDQYGDGNADAG